MILPPTVYVWRAAETVLDRPLEVSVDEAELLAALERIYQQEADRDRDH